MTPLCAQGAEGDSILHRWVEQPGQCYANKEVGKRTGVEVTSSGCCELRPADKPKVSCPGPEGLRSITEAQAGVEMVSLKSLTIVDGIVATSCMGAIHPDLQEEER